VGVYWKNDFGAILEAQAPLPVADAMQGHSVYI
jgi:hypothetical protein